MQVEHLRLQPDPILNQLHILKQKLDQRGILIVDLCEQLRMQNEATLELIQEFRRHESTILGRLQKLEEINIKYIKDYLLLRKKLEIEDFSSSRSILHGSSQQIFAKKCQQYKQQLSQRTLLTIGKHKTNEVGFVNRCTELLKGFLVDRQPRYEKIIGQLREERRMRLKEVKGVEGFKRSKQEQKCIEAIRQKIKDLNKMVGGLDSENLIEVFNLRKSIEMDIGRLNPERTQMTLQQSQAEQATYQQLIKQIIMTNLYDNKPEKQTNQLFLMGYYRLLQNNVLLLQQQYGQQFVHNIVDSLDGLAPQTKRSILQSQSYQQLLAAKDQGGLRPSAQSESLERQQVGSHQVRKGASGIAIKKIMRKRVNSQGQEEYQQLFEEKSAASQRQSDFANQQNQNEAEMASSLQKTSPQQQILADNTEEVEDSADLIANVRAKRKKEDQSRHQKSSRLNNAFETATTKTFFQQQQKARDKLISKQSTVLQEHEKVIDKLITFIKKEFKDKKLEEIEGDDPQQLMGYYFRVNEKKYVDIKQEMKELSIQKQKVEQEYNELKEHNESLSQEKRHLFKENETVKEENEDLRRKKQKLESLKENIQKQNEVIRVERQSLLEARAELAQMNSQLERQNESMRQQKIALQEVRSRLEEEKAGIEQVLLAQQQEMSAVIVERDNLALKLQLQKLEILALSEIYENIKANTKQFQQITVRTENVVKLSLETLFNTCLNKLSPEQLIERLENLIDLIRVNMQLKKDMTYELTMAEYLDKEEERVKKQFSMKINEVIVPHTSENRDIQRIRAELRQSKREIQADSESQSQKPKSFADHLEDLAIEIIQQSISSQQPVEEGKGPKSDRGNYKQSGLDDLVGKSQFEGINADILLPLISFFKPKQPPPKIEEAERDVFRPEDHAQGAAEETKDGLDQNFIDSMMQRIRQMKFSKFTTDEDMREMYEKYKQALDCLERAQKLNQENQMKYQQFLNDLNAKGAKNSPQSLEDKLFYMERVIKTQNELIENQRVEFEGTIIKQVEKSEELAQDIIKSIKLRRKQTHI